MDGRPGQPPQVHPEAVYKRKLHSEISIDDMPSTAEWLADLFGDAAEDADMVQAVHPLLPLLWDANQNAAAAAIEAYRSYESGIYVSDWIASVANTDECADDEEWTNEFGDG
eukprot:SAG11_NODE_13553_length_650_cov_0.660617_1_plen_111_part_01